MKAVFLDRDGVLNQIVFKEGRKYIPLTLKEFQILPRVDEACRLLKELGYLLCVVTNQPELSRKELLPLHMKEMHDYLMKRLNIDGIYVCGHVDEEKCDCRKPKTGLLERAISDFSIDPKVSFMVGDRDRDMKAGYKMGCRTVFVESLLKENPQADFRAATLYEAAAIIQKESFHIKNHPTH